MPRPSKCYRKKQLPFTRKEYIKKIPNIPDGLKFSHGNTSKFDFPAKVSLVAKIDGQVSAKTLDSIRVTINRELKVLGEQNYRFQINSYPHHIVRMHGLLGIAKAERIAKGMKQAFGNSQYKMAQIKRGHSIAMILINDNAISFGVCKKALSIAIKKLSLKWEIIHDGFTEKNTMACPTLPKRTRESKGGKAVTEKTVPQPQVGK